MSPTTSPQKIASEFDSSVGLAITFLIIVVGTCIWHSGLVVPSVLSALLGVVLAGVTVSLTKSHRYDEALTAIRSKFVLVLVGGLILFLIYREPIQVGVFAFGVYAGFWVAMLALRRVVAEQLTFIKIGADLEKQEIQDVFK